MVNIWLEYIGYKNRINTNDTKLENFLISNMKENICIFIIYVKLK